jgi:hypothetical protein
MEIIEYCFAGHSLPVSSTSSNYGAESIYISYTDDESSLNELSLYQYQLHIEAMRLPREREKCILYDLDTSWSRATDDKIAVFSLSVHAVLWLTFDCMGSWAVSKYVTIDHAVLNVGEACHYVPCDNR